MPQTPRYLQAVRKGDLLAVVASNEWAAIRAARTIAATWSVWDGLPEESQQFEYMRRSKIDRNEIIQSMGNTAKHQGRQPGTAGDLRFSLKYAWIDWPLLRGR